MAVAGAITQAMLLIDRLISIIAPHMCIVCAAEGAVLCQNCLVTAGEPPAPRCVGCKKLSDDFKTCSSCRSWIDIYAVYVATNYEGVYERLLHEYKFNLRRQAVVPLAAIMNQITLSAHLNHVVIVPIPTAPARIRQRGFDHGLLLAREFAKALQLKRGIKVTCKPLLSRRSNNRQLGSSRAQRIRQVHNEFYAKNSNDIIGKTIILTDDVTTTGASLAAAAKTLKNAGAKRVCAVVYAQKV